MIPIVLFNVFDDVDSSWLQSVLEEILESQNLVVWIMGAVVDDEIQVPCITLCHHPYLEVSCRALTNYPYYTTHYAA